MAIFQMEWCPTIDLLDSSMLVLVANIGIYTYIRHESQTSCFLVSPLNSWILFATMLFCVGIELGIYTQLNIRGDQIRILATGELSHHAADKTTTGKKGNHSFL